MHLWQRCFDLKSDWLTRQSSQRVLVLTGDLYLSGLRPPAAVAGQVRPFWGSSVLILIALVRSVRRRSRCVHAAVFNEMQVLLFILVYFLDEHLQVVGRPHAGLLANSSVKCKSQLFRAPVERKDALVVAYLFPFKFSLWRQLYLTVSTSPGTWRNASLLSVSRGSIA